VCGDDIVMEMVRKQEIYLGGDLWDQSHEYNYHCYGCGYNWYDEEEYRRRKHRDSDYTYDYFNDLE
jgi:transposase-like protein